MAGAGGLLPGAAGEKWEEKLCLAEGLVKRLGWSREKLRGFSAGDLQVTPKRRVTAVLSAIEGLDPPGHNLHGHESV